MKVAFIGLGAMGAGMAANQARADRVVSAFDLSPDALRRALEKVKALTTGDDAAPGVDMTAAGSVAEAVSGADVVITMLPAGKPVREVYTGQVFGAAPKSALLIDCSTIDVETARQVAGLAAAEGYVFGDAPVSGGTAAADGGTLAFMVGCEAAAFPRFEAALKPMARAVIRAGDHGAGQAAKICNNMLLAISMIGTCEAIALAERLGLDPAVFFDIASKSSGQSWSLTSYCPWPGPVPAAPSNRGYEGGFLTSLMLKDLKLAQDAAAKAGATTPLGAQAEALYALFDRLGYGGKDFSAMLQLFRGRLNDLGPA